MCQTLVSVIIPVFNDAERIEKILWDLVNQDYSNFEAVVVNDASVDGTASVLDRIANQDSRIKVISLSENRGVSVAREVGLEHARGTYVWFVDSDDRLPACSLSLLVRGTSNNTMDIVIGGVRVVSNGRTETSLPDRYTDIISGSEGYKRLLLGEIRGQLWDKLIRREVLDSAKFTHTRVHSDLALTVQSISAAGQISFVGEVVYEYCVRSGSIIGSAKRRSPYLRSVLEVVEQSSPSGFVEGGEYSYFKARFIALSILRDMDASVYSDDDQALLLAEVRRLVNWSSIRVAVFRREYQRALSFVSARYLPGIYRAARRLARVSR